MNMYFEKIENELSYLINPKRAKRKSHKKQKQMRSRTIRRKIKQDITYVPHYNKHSGWEF